MLFDLILATLTSSLVIVLKFLNPLGLQLLWQNQVVSYAVRIQSNDRCEDLRMACLVDG